MTTIKRRTQAHTTTGTHAKGTASTLTEDEVIELMRVTQGSLSLRDFGKKLGVSGMFISDIYHGRRSPGPKILKYFGIGKNRRTVVEYVVFKK